MDNFLNNFFFKDVFDLFLKVFLIVLSLIYLLYTVVSSKNIKVMTKTLEDKFNYFIIFISSLQIFFALILLIFTVFLI